MGNFLSDIINQVKSIPQLLSIGGSQAQNLLPPTGQKYEPSMGSNYLVPRKVTNASPMPVQQTQPAYHVPAVPTPLLSQISQPQVQQQTPQPQQTNTLSAIARNPNYSNFNIDPSVIRAIQTAGQQQGVPAQFLGDVALQESSFDPRLVNSTPDGKAAGNPTGLFQFTDGTWNDILNQYNNKPGMSLKLPTTDRTDPLTNALAAAYLIKHGQLDKWAASEGTWGNYWTPQELEQLGYYDQSPTHIQGKRFSQVGYKK